MTLREKLIVSRNKAGLSQMELAERLGVSRQAVSRWESGDTTPTMDKLKTLARIYGVSLDWLCSDAADREPPEAAKPEADRPPDDAPAGKEGEKKQKTEIAATKPDALIAPLLFISLIENAFKHGVSNSKPSFIDLDIHQKGDRIVCHLKNSYFPKDAEQDKSGSGIGIKNLRKRLELIYPNRHIFSYGVEGDNYYSMLELQISGEEPKSEK